MEMLILVMKAYIILSFVWIFIESAVNLWVLHNNWEIDGITYRDLFLITLIALVICPITMGYTIVDIYERNYHFVMSLEEQKFLLEQISTMVDI